MENIEEILIKDIKNKNIHHFTLPQISGIRSLTVWHSECPGFDTVKEKFLYNNKWDDLNYYDHIGSHLDHPEKFRELNPILEINAKIVCIYRSPLDHFVSFYNHLLNHIRQDLRYRLVNNTRKLMESPRELALDGGALNSYIKQIYTFFLMKELKPNNIMLCNYEDLFSNPESYFRNILSFFGHEIINEEAFMNALHVSSIDNLKKIQIETGPFAHDQIDKREKHIRDGTPKEGIKYFEDKDIDYIRNKFLEFDLIFDASTQKITFSNHNIILPKQKLFLMKHIKIFYFLKKHVERFQQKIKSLFSFYKLIKRFLSKI